MGHVTCAIYSKKTTYKTTCKTCSSVYKAIAEHTNCSSMYYPYHRVQAKAPGARRTGDTELRTR